MNKDFTPYSNSEFAALVRNVIRQEKKKEPKESTLNLIRSVAHNFRISNKLPEDLQGYVLS